MPAQSFPRAASPSKSRTSKLNAHLCKDDLEACEGQEEMIIPGDFLR
jgi:hypothetical protein